MTAPLTLDRDGPVAVITFNRPDKRNAISPEVACRLADAYAEARDDPAIRCVVLTGAGDRAFCSGGDLDRALPLLSGARAPEDDWDRRFLDGDALTAETALTDGYPKPVIAAVNGACLAGGMEILLGTDIRLSTPDATFALPEAARGVIPFAGALARLPRQIPHALAMEMLLTGGPIDAETARAAGLIGRIVPREDLMDAAMETARIVAANAPVALSWIKRTVAAAAGRPLAEGLTLEAEARRAVMATEDAREGPRAFVERRPPVYEGR